MCSAHCFLTGVFGWTGDEVLNLDAPLKDSGRYRGPAFSFRRASLTCFPFGVGKGGPETFSPDMLGL